MPTRTPRSRASVVLRLVVLAPPVVILALASWLLLPTVPEPDYLGRKGILTGASIGGTWPVPGGEIEEIQLTSSNGVQVNLSLRKPTHPLPGRPLLIMISGQETGRKAVELLPDTRGVAVAALGYPFGVIPHRDLWALAVALPTIQQGIPDIPATVMLALDYLTERPDLAPEQVELAGISFGAYIATIPAALDPRIDRLWLVHGSGNPQGVIDSVLTKRIEHDGLRGIAAWFLATGAYSHHLAPEHWVGRMPPRPLIVISAEADSTLPLHAVNSLHSALRPPSEVLWSPGNHVHPKRPETINYITELMFERISGHSSASEDAL